MAETIDAPPAPTPAPVPLRLPITPARARQLASLAAVHRDAEPIPVAAPFTGVSFATIPRGTPADIREAVARARAAQRAWQERPLADRARVLAAFEARLLEHREEIIDLIQLESGKARRYAFDEVIDTALVARHYAVHAARYLRPKRRRGALPVLTTAIELHHPVGVVGVVAPWNFPLILAITDALAALVAGNAVVLRPDVQSSFSALWAAELLYACELPRDVLLVVTGEGPELGPPLVDSVDFVMFTGSTRTGKTVARQASERLIGYSLELGGKNPMIVLPDADVDAAVDGAVRGSFTGAGQVCVSIERLYVPAALHDRFVARFVERTRALRLAPVFDYTADVGSLTTRRQLETVEAHVADAVAKGATVLAGGRARPDLGPWFFEPTILTGVKAGMIAHAEETFGPVVSIYAYDDVEQAIAAANDTRYGLNASVWSRSTRNALSVARRLRAGSVNVNEVYAATWTATGSPIGGMKESGVGRRHGEEGILKYTEAQTIAVQRFIPLAPPPFLAEPLYTKLMTRIVKLLGRVPGLR